MQVGISLVQKYDALSMQVEARSTYRPSCRPARRPSFPERTLDCRPSIPQQSFDSTAVISSRQGREANFWGRRRARLAQEAAAASGSTDAGSGGRVPVQVTKPEDVAFVADTAQRVDAWLRVRDSPA